MRRPQGGECSLELRGGMMGREIERKFLVVGGYAHLATQAERVVQGFLSSVPERTVRVRLMGAHGFLTVKGRGDAHGISRFEWEMEIPAADAQALLALCEPGVIEKTRHRIPAGAHVFEVDEFHGANEGLVVAEIELTHEDEAFDRPGWLGVEVTGDPKYYNANLSRRPFSSW
jgi:CYTH domain-containing protein